MKQKILKGFNPEVKAGYGAWFPEDFPQSKEARDLIASLLHSEPAKRPSCSEALAHPWFKEKTAISSLQLKSFQSFKAHHQANQNKSRFFDAAVRFSYATAPHMTEAQNESLRSSFAAFDTDGNGEIDWNEFLEGMRANTSIQDEAELKEMFTMLDTDKSGSIGIEEMAIAMEEQMLLARKERLWQIFEKLDANGDRRLSKDELTKGLASIPDFEVDIDELMAEADEDGDGTIDWHEFVDIMSPKMEPSTNPRPAPPTSG